MSNEFKNKSLTEAVNEIAQGMTKEQLAEMTEPMDVQISFTDGGMGTFFASRRFHTIADAVSFLRHWESQFKTSVKVLEATFKGWPLDFEGVMKMITPDPKPFAEVIKTQRRGHHVMFRVKTFIPSIRVDLDDDSPNKRPDYMIGDVDGHWDGEAIVLEQFQPYTWNVTASGEPLDTEELFLIGQAVKADPAFARVVKSIQKSERVYNKRGLGEPM